MKTVCSWWILQRSEKTEKRNWNFIFLKLQDFVKRILIKLKEKSGVVKMIILSFLQSRFLMDLFLTDIIIYVVSSKLLHDILYLRCFGFQNEVTRSHLHFFCRKKFCFLK